MTEEEINRISEELGRYIEKLTAAGIKDKTLLAVELKFRIKDFFNRCEKIEVDHEEE